jgi:hypothetical protein
MPGRSPYRRPAVNERAAPRRCSFLRQLDADVLRLEIGVEALEALLTPKAALAIATEGKLHSPTCAVSVDEDLS